MPFSFIHCPYGGRCSSPRLPAGDAAGGPLARPEGAGRLIPHLVRRGSHNALWCVGCWPCSIPRAGCGVESLHTHEPLPGWRSCTPRAVGAGPGCGCCSCWGFSVPSPPDAARAPPTRRGTAPSLIPHLAQQAPQQARVQPLGWYVRALADCSPRREGSCLCRRCYSCRRRCSIPRAAARGPVLDPPPPTRCSTSPTSESRARWVTQSPSPAPRPAASPRGECPAPWATVLPTGLPRHESPRLLVLAPRAAAVLGAGCWVWSAVCGVARARGTHPRLRGSRLAPSGCWAAGAGWRRGARADAGPPAAVW